MYKGKYSVEVDNTQAVDKFQLILRPIVTPFILLFYIRIEGSRKKRLMIVWADMLNDTSFRHLCRLLLNYHH